MSKSPRHPFTLSKKDDGKFANLFAVFDFSASSDRLVCEVGIAMIGVVTILVRVLPIQSLWIIFALLHLLIALFAGYSILTTDSQSIWTTLIKSLGLAIGLFSFLGFISEVTPFHHALPKSYFRASDPERRFYQQPRAGGLKTFKRIAAFLNNEQFFFKGGKSKGLEAFIAQTCQSEVNHLIPLIIILLFSLVCIGRVKLSAFFVVNSVNLCLNVYPVLLQRYNRDRAVKILDQ